MMALIRTCPSFLAMDRAGSSWLQPRPTVIDQGYAGMPRGWYDAQCQGEQNDYCRYVGDDRSPFWSCALAGSGADLTPPGAYSESTTNTLPCIRE